MLINRALSGKADDRQRAIGAIHRIPSRFVANAALGLLAASDVKSRTAGAAILGQLGAPTYPFREESCRALVSLMDSETSVRVLEAAVLALGHLGDRRRVKPLIRLRSHPSPRVRRAVAEALAGAEAQAGIAALIELSQDPVPSVRDWATTALGSMSESDSAQIRQALAARADDSDSDIRAEAILGLARRRDARACGLVARELQSEEVGSLIVEAAAELADRRLRPALEALGAWWDVDVALLERALLRCSR